MPRTCRMTAQRACIQISQVLIHSTSQTRMRHNDEKAQTTYIDIIMATLLFGGDILRAFQRNLHLSRPQPPNPHTLLTTVTPNGRKNTIVHAQFFCMKAMTHSKQRQVDDSYKSAPSSLVHNLKLQQLIPNTPTTLNPFSRQLRRHHEFKCTLYEH